ncbi:MAG: serpin family protein [Dictyoglomus turgidum]|uniref:serpin family protein n=1 Tax=Dictyoglomus turgidum TaxID=513050 RepID=UPI003C72F5FD
MKNTTKIFVLLILLIFSFALAENVDKNLLTIAKGNNLFGLNLYQKLTIKEGGNIFISPYSISSALAMTYAGASGNTKKQMSEVLYFNLPDDELHFAFSKLNSILNTPKSDFQLAIANSLWGQINYPFQEDFLDLVKKYYSAGFNLVDFVDEINREKARNEINKWVEDRTNQKIRELIHKEDLNPMTRLVLVNAIYFKGKWKYTFNKEETREMPFFLNENKTLKVSMMHQINEFNYYEDKNLQAIELPYSGNELSMVVILPKERNLSKIEKNLTYDMLNSISRSMEKEKVDLYIPRFKIEKRYILNEALMKLGMTDAFIDMLADFSGMTEDKDLYISKVIHQSFIEVNEEGTEAAAATAVIMSGKSIGLGPKVFKADHPFLFFIIHKPTNTILFMGRFIEP